MTVIRNRCKYFFMQIYNYSTFKYKIYFVLHYNLRIKTKKKKKYFVTLHSTLSFKYKYIKILDYILKRFMENIFRFFFVMIFWQNLKKKFIYQTCQHSVFLSGKEKGYTICDVCIRVPVYTIVYLRK